MKFYNKTNNLISLDSNNNFVLDGDEEICFNQNVKFDILKANSFTGSLINIDSNENKLLRSGKGYLPTVVDSPKGHKRWEIKNSPDMTFSFININDLIENNASGEYYFQHDTNNAINNTFTKSNGDAVVYDKTNINGETENIGGSSVTTPSAGALHKRRVHAGSWSYQPTQGYLYNGGNASSFRDYHTYDLSRLTQTHRDNYLSSLVHTVIFISHGHSEHNCRTGSSSGTGADGLAQFRIMFRPWFPEIKEGMTFIVCYIGIVRNRADGAGSSNNTLLNSHIGRGKEYYSRANNPGYSFKQRFRINVPLKLMSYGGGTYTGISDTGDDVQLDHIWPEEPNVAGNTLDSEAAGASNILSSVYTNVIRYKGGGKWQRIHDTNP